MPMMIAGRPDPNPDFTENPRVPGGLGLNAKVSSNMRRHFTHKKLERWIRLQQFVYGLPEEYSYAVCVTEQGGNSESHALVLALLEAGEALSANSSRVILHKVMHRLTHWMFRRKWHVRGAGKKIARRLDEATEKAS